MSSLVFICFQAKYYSSIALNFIPKRAKQFYNFEILLNLQLHNMNWEKLINGDRLKKSSRITTGDPRNEFESDFGRVIFSPALRRMHDKTQVFPLTTDDHIHSRLTHSMEVMAIGYSLGIRLCENEKFLQKSGCTQNTILRQIPILLKNACLIHDIGNPPFGHFGEEVIKNYFDLRFAKDANEFKLSELEKEDFLKFDGNAQGFRVITKLEVLDNAFGLNLTFGTLGSFLKYPNAGKVNKLKLAQKKRGVFQSERGYLEAIAEGCDLNLGNGIYKRHPLAFIMEAADSICYLVMDLEDGFNKKWYDYSLIKQKLIGIQGLDKIFTALENNHKGYGAEISRVVGLRIHLISRLVALAEENFTKNYDEICSGEYDKELIADDPLGLDTALRDFCYNRIFPEREIQSLELTGHSVLKGLLDYYIDFIFKGNDDYRKRAKGMISGSIIRACFIEKGLDETASLNDLNDYYKLRIIVDFITGMTDQFALNHYQKLSGQKII